ncbi:MAG: FtsH protease activity modulator HflK [Ectothiorhodospiraceae bacterium]|jgi:membrane protease subunit HflK
MAWNEPGGGNRDPWSGGDQGPPDLDEVFRKVKDRIDRLFGGRGAGSGGSGGGFGATGVGLIVAVLVLGWLATGIYIVDQGWRGVVTRFGEYAQTTMPGPHWHLPFPIESVQKVNVEQRRRITIGYEAVSSSRTRPVLSEALMLTQDENIVNVQLAVQYQVSDPARYVFRFRDPDQTLKELTESALREVVGKRNMDFVLTEGRAEVAEQTRVLVQDTLDTYEAGLQVVEVAIQDIQPPEQVQAAFSDAIKAREDKQRFINEAQAYRNEIIPRAQGEAARILEEAEAYRARVVADAEGDTSRFSQLLTEYSKAPAVTRERLYLDTMEQVLSRSGKVMVDVKSGGPLMYLPLEKIMDRARTGSTQSGSGSATTGSGAGMSSGMGSSTSRDSSSRSRTREAR